MFSSAIQRLNDRRHAAGDIGEDAGFTLIELMVVLLILAILLAIAIPTFLGVTKSANDRAAQSNLNTGIINAKAAYQTNSQSYGAPNTINAATLASAEPSLQFVNGTAGTSTGASTSQGIISVAVSSDGNGVVLAAYSKSGNCWYEIDNTSGVATTATAPWAAAGTATGGNASSTATVGTSTSAGGAITFPIYQGTFYAETKGDTVTSDCNAATPKFVATTSTYNWSTTGFPQL
jgi:type IV pilus assembly protein PilA